ncbi:MAG: hypothetical protein QOH49_67 [Acidobacteriota bacterium]|jgi:glycosyltransferase involved in cell wall biosynthesis|nr:hypothetical protein [Acidobacteriota bacterium]
MKQVCIGIHPHEQPEQLRATLESVRRNTAPAVRLILLPDGPDAPMREALRDINVPQFGTDEPLGAAACFNRLAAVSAADVVVLLESGAQVGPGWLEHLLAALDANPRNGLAGPTTNNAWNEQCVYRNGGGSPDELARTAREALKRFGHEARTLEPLYSLADFCYAVRREVFETIGGADESYGLGPCWEMDYNARAARAGFRGVWACAAYVRRAPYTARRRREEALRFEASKHLYQNKFCGARLRGEKTDYRAHCRGDACPEFAPPALIEIKRPLHKVGREAVPQDIEPPFAERVELTPRPQTDPVSPLVQAVTPQFPHVSCIMPTYNRRGFVPLAVRNFLRQDYPNLELVILDDGTDPAADCVPEDVRIRYLRSNRRLSIGAKRNAACEQARGSIIVHWDDDDWYPPWRVSAQVRALLDGGGDVSGTSRVLYFDAAADRAWEYRYAATARAPWVAGNTLAYRRDFWERNKFPDVQVGEDSLFLWNDVTKSVSDLNDPGLCVGMVHAGNTSPKTTGGMFWHARPVTEVRGLLGDDLHLYLALFPPAARGAWPLVSCIMPTYNRRGFIPLAVENFLAQDYPRKELIVVDDGADEVGDLVRDLPGVRYERLAGRASIGAKRNVACEMAEGEVIAHWDDDDWYAPSRLRYQVRPLLADEADLTGLENSFVLQLPGGAFWTTQPQLHRRMFVGDVHGGTLVYRRDLLSKSLCYPDINLAEDAWLLHHAMSRGRRLLRLPNPGLFVYVRHGSNAWIEFAPGSFLDPAGWQTITAPYNFTSKHLSLYRTAAACRP